MQGYYIGVFPWLYASFD